VSQFKKTSLNQSQIQKRISALLLKSKDICQQRLNRQLTQNQTIDQFIAQTPSLPKKIVDRFFITDKSLHISAEIFGETRRSLHEVREILNGFSREKRFFILETVDFFRNPTYIDKVLPALLNPAETDQKKEMLEFVYHTFRTLNKNIETIISNPTLIEKESIHIERGGLYSFSSDIARLIIRFFDQQFIKQYSHFSSDIAIITEIFKKSPDALIPNLIDNESKLRQLTLSFISSIQTHDFLLLYAQKRHAYYKLFLKNIAVKYEIKGLEPIQINQILAGCLLRNPQLAPGDSLITRLTTEEHLKNSQTEKEYGRFVDQLIPSTVFSIIEDFKRSARTILDPKVVKKQVDKENRLLKKVFTPGFIRKKIKQSFRT